MLTEEHKKTQIARRPGHGAVSPVTVWQINYILYRGIYNLTEPFITFRLWAGLDCVFISYISSPQRYIERVKITTIFELPWTVNFFPLCSTRLRHSSLAKLSRFLSEPIIVLTAPPEWYRFCRLVELLYYKLKLWAGVKESTGKKGENDPVLGLP